MSLLDPRKSLRKPLSSTVRVFEADKFLWRVAQGLDISDTGMRLAIPVPIEKGMRVRMAFLMPGQPCRTRIDGKVVWRSIHEDETRPFQCGILFDNVKKSEAGSGGTPLYFMGDRMCDFVIKMTPHDLVARPARSLAEIKKSFKLIYKEYSSLGYCEANDARMYYSDYILSPGSRTFILKKKNHFLGTVSLIEDSPWGIPMEATFNRLIDKIRRRNRKLAEVSHLTLDREAFRKSKFTLTGFHKLTASFWLFKSMLDYARHDAGVTDLLITVHPKHEKLYRNFAFRTMGRAVPYEGAKGHPGLPMHLDVEGLERCLPKTKSFRKFFFDEASPAADNSRLFNWTADALSRFLVEKQDAWARRRLKTKVSAGAVTAV